MPTNKANFTDADVIAKLKRDISAVESSSAWAKANGFSRSYVSDVLSGRRNVSERLATALGFERVPAWKTL